MEIRNNRLPNTAHRDSQAPKLYEAWKVDVQLEPIGDTTLFLAHNKNEVIEFLAANATDVVKKSQSFVHLKDNTSWVVTYFGQLPTAGVPVAAYRDLIR